MPEGDSKTVRRSDSRDESEQQEEVEMTAAVLASLEGKVWAGSKTLLLLLQCLSSLSIPRNVHFKLLFYLRCVM